MPILSYNLPCENDLMQPANEGLIPSEGISNDHEYFAYAVHL